jgi:D(-)-tartrate dehydratase
MRIVDIRERAIPLKSDMRNSSFDFSEMTTSVVAVITDVVRDSRPVVGFAFNSTGRYACGAAMRARFIPRILGADPCSLLDEAQTNFDPGRILAAMMQREKSGGHSERSIAIGTIEVAVWDAVAKIAEKPLHRVLAERYNGGKVAEKVFCYVGGGWYFPGQTVRDLQDEMRRHLDAGYTMVKMKVGGLALAEDVRRIEAVKAILPAHAQLAVDANSKFGREEALAYAKALAPFQLRWFEEPCDPLDFALLAEIASHYGPPLATGENLFSTQDVENLARFGGLRSDRTTSSRSIRRRHTASCNMRAPPRCWRATAGRGRRCFPTAATRCRWPSPQASASAGRNPIPACSAPSADSPTTPNSTAAISRCPTAPASASRGNRRSMASCASLRRERESRAFPRTAARRD